MAGKIIAGTVRSRRKVILAAIALITGALVGGVTTAAFASFSNFGYYTVNGQQDVNYAFLSTTTSPVAYAQTRTGPYSPTYVSSGWVGSRGRLFITSSGALSCEGTTSYSNVGLTYPSNWNNQSCTRTSHNSWYSYGVSYSWNGSGYNAWYTYISPSETN